MARSCRLLGVSRQALYQQSKRDEAKAEHLKPVLARVQEVRRTLPQLGTRKLHHMLKPELKILNIKLGRDGLFTLLRQHQLLVRPKRSYTKTTYSKHWMRKHPNLLHEKTIQKSETVFVSDITYVESMQGVHYLSLVTDAFSRKIMGYELSHNMKASDTLKALQMAIKNRQTKRPLIHHSDRGSQYCSELYQECLRKHGIRPSMTDGYDCYQNALAERINGILKQEFLLYKCQTFDDLDSLIAESIYSYNEMRPHLSLEMQTPNDVHKKAS